MKKSRTVYKNGEKRERISIYLALSAVALWSTVATAFKIALKYVDFINLLLYASFVSMIILSIASIFTRYKPSISDILISIPLGFLNPFLYYLILFRAYSLLPAQTAMALNYTWPLMIVLFSSIFLRQKPTLKEITGLLMGFSGAGLIALLGKPSSTPFHTTNAGILLALSSAVVWGVYWICNMKRKIPEVLGLSLNFFWGFLFVLFTVIIIGKLTLPKIQGIIATTYVGFFEMGVTFVLWLKALNLARRTAVVSNLIYLTPFLSLMIISLILKEPISIWTIAGISLIITGILIQRTGKKDGV